MPTAGSWKVPFKGKFSPYDTEGNRMVPAFSISSRQRNTTVKTWFQVFDWSSFCPSSCVPILSTFQMVVKIFPGVSTSCLLKIFSKIFSKYSQIFSKYSQNIFRCLHLLPAPPISRGLLLIQPFVNPMTGGSTIILRESHIADRMPIGKRDGWCKTTLTEFQTSKSSMQDLCHFLPIWRKNSLHQGGLPHCSEAWWSRQPN